MNIMEKTMNKCVRTGSGTGVVLALTAIAMSAPVAVHAGPACMNDQRMSRGYYPHSPMRSQMAYGQPAPPPYYGAWTPWGMPPPYNRQMPVLQGNSVVTTEATTPAASATSGDRSGRDSEPVTETITVRINGMRFEPENITVMPGTKVTWVHAGGMPHTITGNTEELRSGTLYNGQEYSHIFAENGQYKYFCSLHPAMTGSVVVANAEKDS
jgi:plastocyanin